MENKYALLNYDMENMVPTPEFTKATKFLDGVIKELVDGIKSGPMDHIDEDPGIVGWAFYGNLHWGSIGEDRGTGDDRVDALINTAIQKIHEFVKTEDHGGIGDTATDECIADEVDRLMRADSKMHPTLCNRA